MSQAMKIFGMRFAEMREYSSPKARVMRASEKYIAAA
jgi:hypothetical protein